MNYLRPLFSLLLLGFVLWRNLPGALLCLKPGLTRARKGSEDDKGVDDSLFEQMSAELAPLGFQRLGVHYEKAPLRRALLSYDFVHPAEQAFGSAFRYGKHVRFYLLTPFRKGGFVLTADHKRYGSERDGYLVGGVPGATPEQLLAAHRRRVARLKEQGFELEGELSLDARVEAASRWFAGAGVREIRLRHMNAFLIFGIGLVLVAAILVGVARSP
ncbi:MAG: hypothetical protein ACOX6T_22870 [Myxococcales bacterium]